MEKSVKITIEIHNWKELAQKEVGRFGSIKLWIGRNLLGMDVQANVEQEIVEQLSKGLDDAGVHHSIHVDGNAKLTQSSLHLKEEEVAEDETPMVMEPEDKEEGFMSTVVNVVSWPCWKTAEISVSAYDILKRALRKKPVREIHVNAMEFAIIPDEN